MKVASLALLASSVAGIALGAEPSGPCCTTCTAPKEKFYSIDTTHNMCGECCMEPKYFPIYKIFEPGLAKADDNTPCKDKHFSGYDSTVTHGFGPVKMTLDLYKPDPSSLMFKSHIFAEAGPTEAQCSAKKTETDCNGLSGCSWCDAGAVPPACHTVDNAKKLPLASSSAPTSPRSSKPMAPSGIPRPRELRDSTFRCHRPR